jgi:hypothetical protein
MAADVVCVGGGFALLSAVNVQIQLRVGKLNVKAIAFVFKWAVDIHHHRSNSQTKLARPRTLTSGRSFSHLAEVEIAFGQFGTGSRSACLVASASRLCLPTERVRPFSSPRHFRSTIEPSTNNR